MKKATLSGQPPRELITKKLLPLILVLGVVSTAGAIWPPVSPPIAVVQSGWDDNNQNGVIDESDVIYLSIDLITDCINDAYDLGLNVTGPGTLLEVNGGPLLNHALAVSEAMFPMTYSGIGGDGNINQIMHQDFMGVWGPGPFDLVWGLAVRCDGPGDIIVDLTRAGYASTRVYCGGDVWHILTEEDLGDLVITVVLYDESLYVDDVTDPDEDGSIDHPFDTIQEAINLTSDGDTVIVFDGTYTGDGNRDIDFAGKAITVRSENGPAKCIIDCESNGRGFTFTNDEDEDSIVDGFTITNGGNVLFGGGIYCRANPVIRNCAFVNNFASAAGGGICVKSDGGVTPCPKIINCTFSGNTSTIGGAIFCSDMGNPSVFNCILWGDNATDGPEIAIMTAGSDTELSISYSNVQGGASAIYGGSLLDWGPGNIDADPLFADPSNGDYHLKSQAGRWDPNTESWVTDEVTSPAIDAGNPGCPVGEEPAPNGNRINMGAYGGTAEASKSPANWALLADLTNNGIVDFVDLAVFFGYWPDSGQCVPADLDRSETVDLLDYAIFAGQRSMEPGIEYEIFDCDLGATSFFAAQESLETRFTVTVEGQYIHFEDMMVANCCATALWLDMNAEDDLITIFEHEFTIMPCYCICDFPIAATLGPFEDGTYLLEVYEDWGGFIGSTIVTIGPE